MVDTVTVKSPKLSSTKATRRDLFKSRRASLKVQEAVVRRRNSPPNRSRAKVPQLWLSRAVWKAQRRGYVEARRLVLWFADIDVHTFLGDLAGDTWNVDGNDRLRPLVV